MSDKNPDNKPTENDQSPIPDPSPDYDPVNNAAPEGQPPSPSPATGKPDTKTPESPGAREIPPQNQPMTVNEERTWAMLAHLSVLINLVTGFFGGIAAIVIYFIYKDRSRFVAYHAMQSFIFQCITWIGAGVIGGIFIAIGSTFGALIIPLLCLIPGFLFLLLAPASIVYGIIGGVKVNNGEDFRYWQVGDWVRNILEPEQKTS